MCLPLLSAQQEDASGWDPDKLQQAGNAKKMSSPVLCLLYLSPLLQGEVELLHAAHGAFLLNFNRPQKARTKGKFLSSLTGLLAQPGVMFHAADFFRDRKADEVIQRNCIILRELCGLLANRRAQPQREA